MTILCTILAGLLMLSIQTHLTPPGMTWFCIHAAIVTAINVRSLIFIFHHPLSHLPPPLASSRCVHAASPSTVRRNAWLVMQMSTLVGVIITMTSSLDSLIHVRHAVPSVAILRSFHAVIFCVVRSSKTLEWYSRRREERSDLDNRRQRDQKRTLWCKQ